MASALKPPPTPFQLSRPSISPQPLLSLPGGQNGMRKTTRFVMCSRRKPTSDHAMTLEILMKQVMEATRGLKIGRSPIIDQTTSLETLKENIEKIEKIMGRKILEKGLDDVLDSDTLKERVKEILGSKTLQQWIEELGNSEALDKVIEKGIRSKRLKRGFLEAVRFAREREARSEKLKRSPLRPGKVSPRLSVPANIPRPPYVGSSELPELSRGFQIHDSDGIERMRAACQLAARVLEYAGTLVRPSVTTDEIDRAVHKMIIDAGAYPSPLGYGGFPKSVCTSVNECMCHGIPDSRPLEDGDIINIDVTVYLNGYHGDTSKTFLCGDVDKRVKRLVQVAEECLQKGIAVCKDGLSFQKIGKRISERAEMYNYGIVERFVGHGVGTIFHSEPIIHHIRGSDYRGKMVEGLTFTIEPILTLGSTECEMWDDNWTAVTADGFPAAQFEHTILITRSGAEILTKL